jgi:hypothetical protein
VAGWLTAPVVISTFSPSTRPDSGGPLVVARLLWSASPATQVLGSLKAWPRLAVHIALLLATRWTFPWVLSDVYEPLEGVALGNVWAAAVTGASSLWLVGGAATPRTGGAAA